MFFRFVNLLQPDIVEEPNRTYLNIAISTFCSFKVVYKLLYYVIQNSPYSWNAAGSAIQIGLIEEIDTIMSPHSSTITNQDNVKRSQNLSTDFFDSIHPSPSKATESSTTTDEQKHVKKRKHQSSTYQTIPSLNDTIRVKISWEDSKQEPLEGIIVNKGRNQYDIDIIPKSGYSRGWSEHKSMNAICRNHFFYQPENNNSPQDLMDSKFRNIISLGHVVPPTGHTGLVPQAKDTDFIGAKYKVKAFLKEIATKRLGLFHCTSSKPLEIIGDLKKGLPECLKKKIFELHTPGQPKRTH